MSGYALAVNSHVGTDRLPIRMLNVIPATASVGRRLAWSAVVAIGQHVRQVQIGDRVLYDPEDLAEVELHGEQYVLLRERDIHAVAAPRVEDDRTGLYL